MPNAFNPQQVVNMVWDPVTSAWVKLQTPMAITTTDNFAIDAFGRQRVSAPDTIFDSKQLYDNGPLVWSDVEVSGGGTGSTFSANRASVVLDVTAETAGRRTRQTKRRFNYQPGKSMLIIVTGRVVDPGDGITQRIGYFDNNNGLFFEVKDGVIGVVKRTNVTGTPDDIRVDQDDWNLDPMNGSGPSGITLNASKVQIGFIDIEWLGVGRVRFGLVVNGLIYYVHQFVHSNIIESVYMSTPNLPIRYEIINDGTGGAASLEHICSTVISEGGDQDTDVHKAASQSFSEYCRAASSGTLYAVIGMRLKSTHLSKTVRPVNLDLISPQNTILIRWRLCLNPTYAGTFTYADVTNSAVQIAKGATANSVSAVGTVLAAGYTLSRTQINVDLGGNFALGSTYAGVSDEVVLVCDTTGTNCDIAAVLQWSEHE